MLRSIKHKTDPDVAGYLRTVLDLVERGEVIGFTLIAQCKPVGNDPPKMIWWRAGLDDRRGLLGDLYLLMHDLANRQ